MTKFEEWRIREIGVLMQKAGELLLDEEDKQELFYKISRKIDFFGLYETGGDEVKKLVEEFEIREKRKTCT